MADSKGIEAGRAYVKLFADDSLAVRGLKNFESHIRGVGDRISSVGKRIGILSGGWVAVGTAAAAAFVELGSELATISTQTGISVEALSELRGAVDLQVLVAGMRKFQTTLADAFDRVPGATLALTQFGVTAQELAALPVDQQLERIADGFNSIQNPAQRTRAVMDLFGRSGQDLIPFLQRGSEGIQQLRAAMAASGAGMTGEQANAAKSLGKELKILKGLFMNITIAIGTAVAPALKWWTQLMQSAVKPVVEWARNNRTLVTAIFGVLAGLLGLSIVLTTLGPALGVVATGVGLLASAFVALSGSIVGLAGLGIVAAIAGYITVTGQWGESIQFVRDQVDDLGNFVEATWAGIGGALRANDIGLAMEITWLAATAVMTNALNFLNLTFLQWKNDIINVWDVLSTRLAQGMTITWTGLKIIWHLGIAAIEIAWRTATTGLQMAWLQFASVVESAWVRVTTLIETRSIASANRAAQEVRDAYQEQIDTLGRQNDPTAAWNNALAGAQQIQQQGQGVVETLGNDLAGNQAARARQMSKERLFAAAQNLAADAALQAAIDRGVDAGRGADTTARRRGGRQAAVAGADTLGEANGIKTSTTGSFSAAAAAGLAGNLSLQERSARAAERSALALGRLVNHADNGGLVFA